MESAKKSSRIEAYLEFADSNPEHFREIDGESWVCRELDEINKIEAVVAERYRAKGLNPAWAEIGVYYEDPHCVLVRDAVRFGSGRVVIHHRVLWKNGPVSGVVMLPRLRDKFVLVRHYRHPVSDWSWECPRGGTSRGEGFEVAVEKELFEEIGAEVLHSRRLGKMFPINSFIDSGVELFLVDIDNVGNPGVSEGIEDVRAISSSKVKAMITGGEITDASTICAVAQAEFQGWL